MDKTFKRILELTSQQPMTANELACKMSTPLTTILACLHEAWWEIQATAGESGWLYAPRAVVTKPVREFGMFNDVGISRRNW